MGPVEGRRCEGICRNGAAAAAGALRGSLALGRSTPGGGAAGTQAQSPKHITKTKRSSGSLGGAFSIANRKQTSGFRFGAEVYAALGSRLYAHAARQLLSPLALAVPMRGPCTALQDSGLGGSVCCAFLPLARPLRGLRPRWGPPGHRVRDSSPVARRGQGPTRADKS